MISIQLCDTFKLDGLSVGLIEFINALGIMGLSLNKRLLNLEAKYQSNLTKLTFSTF